MTRIFCCREFCGRKFFFVRMCMKETVKWTLLQLSNRLWRFTGSSLPAVLLPYMQLFRSCLQIVVSLFVAVILDNLELDEDIKKLKQVCLWLLKASWTSVCPWIYVTIVPLKLSSSSFGVRVLNCFLVFSAEIERSCSRDAENAAPEAAHLWEIPVSSYFSDPFEIPESSELGMLSMTQLLFWNLMAKFHWKAKFGHTLQGPSGVILGSSARLLEGTNCAVGWRHFLRTAAAFHWTETDHRWCAWRAYRPTSTSRRCATVSCGSSWSRPGTGTCPGSRPTWTASTPAANTSSCRCSSTRGRSRWWVPRPGELSSPASSGEASCVCGILHRSNGAKKYCFQAMWSGKTLASPCLSPVKEPTKNRTEWWQIQKQRI